MKLTYDIQEQRGKETMADFKKRTEGVAHPLIEKIFNENDIDFIIHCGSIGGARGIEDKDTTIEDNLSHPSTLKERKNSNKEADIREYINSEKGRAMRLKRLSSNLFDLKF